MKILITTEWYKPVINGVVTSVLNLQRELTDMGHEVKILTLSNTKDSYTEGDVTYIASVSAELVYPQARLAIGMWSEEIRKLIAWGPQIIHSQCEFSTFLIAGKIAGELNIPIVHTYHTVYEDYTHYFSPVKKWGRAAVSAFTRKVLSHTQCVIVPTEKVRQILLRYGVAEEIRVIPTGIDMEKYSHTLSGDERVNLRLQLGIPVQAGVAVFVGRLAQEKNLEEIISMLSLAKPENFRLLIVGDGPHRQALEAYVDECGIRDMVIFTGMVSPDEIYKYYQVGDVFVSASTSETQGLTYVEALANGLPALCRKDECLKDVVKNGINGWQYEDFNEFSEKLKLFLKPENREMRFKMSVNAREGVYQRYSSGCFAANVLDAYAGTIRKSAVFGMMRAV
ncbi:MAG: glycosyltransferase family 4 protein [Lachnospiraceae bacterium]|nr:glycosyltransferase family 4 protein [Lachnospiraceae bacterium]